MAKRQYFHSVRVSRVWGRPGRIYLHVHRVVLASLSCVFRLSSFFSLPTLSLLCSCAHRWVPVSFPFTCACWGICTLGSSSTSLLCYSFRFFCQFGFPCDDVASWSCCRLEFYKSRLSVCAVCRWLELGGYEQCDNSNGWSRSFEQGWAALANVTICDGVPRAVAPCVDRPRAIHPLQYPGKWKKKPKQRYPFENTFDDWSPLSLTLLYQAKNFCRFVLETLSSNYFSSFLSFLFLPFRVGPLQVDSFVCWASYLK